MSYSSRQNTKLMLAFLIFCKFFLFNFLKEMSKPSTVKNWGWCREHCSKNERDRVTPQKKLQETKLSILTDNECKDLGKTVHANVSLELCAGQKNYFPTVKKFKRIKNKRTKEYSFKFHKDTTNYLGMPPSKYDFYIGGSDSCQG